MKLRLKDKDLPPVQLRLTLPGSLKASLDEYVGYLNLPRVGGHSG